MTNKTKEPAVSGSVVDKAEAINMTVKQTNEQGDKAIEKRKDAARVLNNAGWGLPQIKEARHALMAITAFYGLDPVMGDVMIMGGKTLYICEQAYKKKLDEIATEKFEGKPWRWVKRPATKEEVEAQGYAGRTNPRVWYVELYMPEGFGDQMVSSAFGEADIHNMALQNSTSQKGDPRVLNRMAIKRAQHECMRDVVVFRLPAPADFEKKMGMAMEKMLESGVNVMLDDGIIPSEHLQAEANGNSLPSGPAPTDVVNGEATEKPKAETETETETEPTTQGIPNSEMPF